MFNSEEYTFEDLELKYNVPPPRVGDEEDFPLPAWYRSVRLTPVSRLSIGDLAKACRQDIFCLETATITINILADDPLSGEMYDGELLASLNGFQKTFWMSNENLANKARGIINKIGRNMDSIYVSREIESLKSKLGVIPPARGNPSKGKPF